ncbi:MAG: hypothetical protein KAS30_05890, partial [Candidatus Diapherotrites archaeon]|nr:hypothetical protein [Candidatus Diapherotrites archaeon]
LTVKDSMGNSDQTHVDKDIVYVTVIAEQTAINTPESNPLIAAIVVFLASMLIFSRKVGKK